MARLRGLFILDAASYGLIYGPEEVASICRHVTMVGPPQTRQSIAANTALLRDVDVLFSGWGAPLIDADFLNAAPKLAALFYGAGSVGYCLTDAAWDRGLRVTTAIEANSRPVAEYTLAMIVLGLKNAWRLHRETVASQTFVDRDTVPGCYRATVGLVSLGRVARLLLSLLKSFDLKVVAYDPFVSSADADALGVELVSLDEVFERSDVVTVHTPLTEQTRGMITGHHLSAMRHGAALINTARGEVVVEPELVATAAARPDLQFILDVTAPEPPVAGSPLYALPNVFVTPHIAGSAGPECRRMGRMMVDELERYVAGEPLRWEEKRPGTPRTPVRLSTTISPQLRRRIPSNDLALEA